LINIGLVDFMICQYKIKDIALKEINYNFVSYFETYLRTVHNCGVNTTAKYLQQLKHIITLAKNNGWIHADPFINFRIRFEKADRGYLLQEELQKMMQKKFSIKRLEQVRDIFVFSCFTGLAYVDVKNLTFHFSLCQEEIYCVSYLSTAGYRYRSFLEL
jgi:hypothetical protein